MENKYYPHLFQKGTVGGVVLKTELSAILWELILEILTEP